MDAKGTKREKFIHFWSHSRIDWGGTHKKGPQSRLNVLISDFLSDFEAINMSICNAEKKRKLCKRSEWVRVRERWSSHNNLSTFKRNVGLRGGKKSLINIIMRVYITQNLVFRCRCLKKHSRNSFRVIFGHFYLKSLTKFLNFSWIIFGSFLSLLIIFFPAIQSMTVFSVCSPKNRTICVLFAFKRVNSFALCFMVIFVKSLQLATLAHDQLITSFFFT